MSSQVPVSRRKGGLGLRLPSMFEPAAKIPSLSGKGRWMTRFFPATYNYNIKIQDLYIGNIRNSVRNENGNNNINS